MPTVSKYNKDPEWFNFKVEHYRKQGISDLQIAQNLGISKNTFYQYLNRYKDFRDAYKRGKAEIVEQIENSIYKRALGFEYEEVTTEAKTDSEGNIIEKHIKKIKKYVPPDATTAIFLLTNLNNKKYKRNPDYNLIEEQEKEEVVID
jgi:transcriptional regulator with XRE-family HTH domain